MEVIAIGILALASLAVAADTTCTKTLHLTRAYRTFPNVVLDKDSTLKKILGDKGLEKTAYAKSLDNRLFENMKAFKKVVDSPNSECYLWIASNQLVFSCNRVTKPLLMHIIETDQETIELSDLPPGYSLDRATIDMQSITNRAEFSHVSLEDWYMGISPEHVDSNTRDTIEKPLEFLIRIDGPRLTEVLDLRREKEAIFQTKLPKDTKGAGKAPKNQPAGSPSIGDDATDADSETCRKNLHLVKAYRTFPVTLHRHSTLRETLKGLRFDAKEYEEFMNSKLFGDDEWKEACKGGKECYLVTHSKKLYFHCGVGDPVDIVITFNWAKQNRLKAIEVFGSGQPIVDVLARHKINPSNREDLANVSLENWFWIPAVGDRDADLMRFYRLEFTIAIDGDNNVTEIVDTRHKDKPRVVFKWRKVSIRGPDNSLVDLGIYGSSSITHKDVLRQYAKLKGGLKGQVLSFDNNALLDAEYPDDLQDSPKVKMMHVGWLYARLAFWALVMAVITVFAILCIL